MIVRGALCETVLSRDTRDTSTQQQQQQQWHVLCLSTTLFAVLGGITEEMLLGLYSSVLQRLILMCRDHRTTHVVSTRHHRAIGTGQSLLARLFFLKPTSDDR